MDAMYKENGLQRVNFPKQTNIAGMKELYKEILKGRLEEECKTSEEVFIESDGEMEIKASAKRLKSCQSPRRLRLRPKRRKMLKRKKEVAGILQ